MTSGPLVALLWRRRLIIGLVATAGVLGVLLAVSLLPRTYVSTSYIRIDASQGSSSAFESTQVNQILLRTYAELLSSRQVAEDVARTLGPPATRTDVRAAVTVFPIAQSELIGVEARAQTPGGAAALATRYAEQGLRSIAGSTSDPRAGRLAQRGEQPASPSAPRPLLYLAVGVVLSLLAGGAAAGVAERLDRRPRDSGRGTFVGLPVFARLTAVDQDQQAWRGAVLRMFLARGRINPASMNLIPVRRLEGAELSALGLARALAENSPPTVVVDADMTDRRRRRRGTRAGAIPAGLSEVLTAGPAHVPGLLKASPFPGTKVLHPGRRGSPDRVLASRCLAQVDERLRREFRSVIYVCPPLSEGMGALAIAALADMNMLLVGDRDTQQQIEDAIEALSSIDVHVSGVVLVKAKSGGRSAVLRRVRPSRPWARRSPRRGRAHPGTPVSPLPDHVPAPSA